MPIQSFSQYLQERTISFGSPNPAGQLVILAGGAGSGKGFIEQYGLDLVGKVFDVDELKAMLLRSKDIIENIKSRTGVDLSKADLRNPQDVKKLHEVLASLRWNDELTHLFFLEVLSKPSDARPNVIFDVTLKNLNKLESICDLALKCGYTPKDISIVWVLDKISVAMEKNSKRERVVPQDILMATHTGASMTMAEIISKSDDFRKYVDGYIYIAFNTIGVHPDNKVFTDGTGGVYVDMTGRIKLKNPGQPLDKNRLTSDVLDKIKQYVPNPQSWDFTA
jgi:hypothetical protein